MARKSFLLRTDPEVLAALHRWAGDELRSVNAQIDYVLRRALRDAGRYPGREAVGLQDSSDSQQSRDETSTG
ncbi:MAG: hypothetical protein F4X36_13115 [Gammaproteobacteria bacterium]|nr:hypothetical protein [Gammaproteobacteria bacterium]